jgi:hypothetical protein
MKLAVKKFIIASLLRQPVKGGHRSTRGGMALVITLILLAVITFMAVTFLVVSHSERSAVSTTTDQSISKLAAETALEVAKTEILAPIIGLTNEQMFDLIVSTNYINPGGFTNSVAHPLNVSYTYANGALLNAADSIQNIANLLWNPRPPVYITNRALGIMEHRYYLDLNRNGRPDPNGLQPELAYNGGHYDTNHIWQPGLPVPGNTWSNWMVGDPEWVGVLDRSAFPPGNWPITPANFALGFPHSATNLFTSRYAYIIVPEGKTLDINYIHDYAKMFNNAMGAGTDSHYRNEGVGTWEMNLGAFLADLNTNMWIRPPYATPYQYFTNYASANGGAAFDDALSVLRYRYAQNLSAILSAQQTMGLTTVGPASGVNLFNTDGIDGYSRGVPPNLRDNATATAWPGSDNPKHFFAIEELYDTNKFASGGGGYSLSERLAIAGQQTNSYDQNTFYRMVSQLGTDSAPEPPKIHLNYANTDVNGQIVPNMQTNFVGWSASQFFTNAAIRLLNNLFATAGNGSFATNFVLNNKLRIQIYPTNFYTPAIHRMLQVAANIYDASTNYVSPSSGLPSLPSVFRPTFSVTANSAYITGYTEVTNEAQFITSTNNITFHEPNELANFKANDMIYGVPLVIGAKKGLPNFNQFAMDTMLQITRKLEFRKANAGDISPNETNQMFTMIVSNTFGLALWNSYTNAAGTAGYNHPVHVSAVVDMEAVMTNEYGVNFFSTNVSRFAFLKTNSWPGFNRRYLATVPYSFQLPFASQTNSFYFLPNATFRYAPSQSFTNLSGIFERRLGFPVPHWNFMIKTRLRCWIVDDAGPVPRIIDYVNLESTTDPYDITDILMRVNQDTYGHCGTPYNPSFNEEADFWCTNRVNPSNIGEPTFGVRNQIALGVDCNNVNNSIWNEQPGYPNSADRLGAVSFFRKNLNSKTMSPCLGAYSTPIFLTNLFYAPFNPTRIIYIHTTWEANDPLVHYTVGDLLNLQHTNAWELPSLKLPIIVTKDSKVPTLGKKVADRYEPFIDSNTGKSTSLTTFDLSLKDPGITESDDWDFPTNKFPTIGRLGRVHRGTPWQTIYLKAPKADFARWHQWAGDTQSFTNWNGPKTLLVDATLTQPFLDWYLLDLFTTSMNDNAGRSQLSVNQTNLAAWSAALSGVIVLTNTWTESELTNGFAPPPPAKFDPLAIAPAGIYDNAFSPALVRIWNGINAARSTFAPKTFSRLGEVLATPELTTSLNPVFTNGSWTAVSPYINVGDPSSINFPTPQQKYGITDEIYERIPQQILGLLKCDTTPRFTVYAYGQALKPAEHSKITSGAFFGLVTNYQIMAETALRATVRVEGAPGNPHAVVESYTILPPE